MFDFNTERESTKQKTPGNRKDRWACKSSFLEILAWVAR